MIKDKIEIVYDKHYKKLMWIPVALFIISLAFLFIRFGSTGEFIAKDVSLSGGVTATINTDVAVDAESLELELSNALGTNINVRQLEEFGTGKQIGLIIESGLVSGLTLEEQNARLKDETSRILGIELDSRNYSSEEVGSSLGQAFFRQLIIAVITAFIFMSIVVFITFRSIAPSIAVIAAALMDIIVTLAIVSAAGMSLTGAGIAAFLLIIGYSVDTDILLTTRVLKRKGEGKLFERMYESMKTGLMMTATALAALLVGYFVSNSFIIKQMFAIILVALIFDVLSTYLTNSAILKIYCNKKGIS